MVSERNASVRAGILAGIMLVGLATQAHAQAHDHEPAGDVAGSALLAYVGKYPFDVVNGHRFLDHPVVKAAVDAAVSEVMMPNWDRCLFQWSVLSALLHEHSDNS
jgi:hypothetical protein